MHTTINGGIVNPSSRISVCRSRRHTVGKGVFSILQGRISVARWATGQAKSSVQQGRASGGQCQGRSSWHGAALWCVELSCLSSGLESASVVSWKSCTPSFWVFLINALATPMPSAVFAQEPMGGAWLFCLTPLLASVELPQEPIYAWSRCADLANLTTCAHILSASPCQTCLLWLR